MRTKLNRSVKSRFFFFIQFVLFECRGTDFAHVAKGPGVGRDLRKADRLRRWRLKNDHFDMTLRY